MSPSNHGHSTFTYCPVDVVEVLSHQDLTGQITLLDEAPSFCGIWSEVREGRWRGLSVCVKTVRYIGRTADILKRGKFVAMYSREMASWASCHHPNVLPFLGYCRDIGYGMSFISPWIHEGSIMSYLSQHVDADRLLLVGGVADGLFYLHNKSIIHGDIKPTNILVDVVNGHPLPLLCDFGVSRALNVSGYTTTSPQNGTIQYMARELLFPPSADEAICATTLAAGDIWSFGMTIYEVFSDQMPYQDIQPHTRLYMHLFNNNLPARPGSPAIERGFDTALWEVLLTCWNLDPSSRPTIENLRKTLWQL
ncbi:kinase-like protein [Panus rudis PR-1116 ss-1]|nr:kinase-like protein [Panus rudis PR-1116 ss-1]